MSSKNNNSYRKTYTVTQNSPFYLCYITNYYDNVWRDSLLCWCKQ